MVSSHSGSGIERRRTGTSSAPLGRRYLHGVCRSCYRHDGDAETQDEAANDELGDMRGRRDDNDAKNDDHRPSEHGLSASEFVSEYGRERSSDDRSPAATPVSLFHEQLFDVHLHGVQRENHSNLGAGLPGMKLVLEEVHRDDTCHQGSWMSIVSLRARNTSFKVF